MLKINTKIAFSQIEKTEFENQKKYLEPYQKQFENRNQGFHKMLDDENILKKIENFDQTLSPQLKNFVILGIGGSSLGFKSILQALPNKTQRQFFVCDNVDPEKLSEISRQLELEKTFFLVITKSGKTPETIAQFLYFREKVLNKKLEQKKHFAFITDKDSFLHRLGLSEDIPLFEIPSNVGGRFSVLSAVGLIPAKILGLDIHQFIEGAKKIRTQFLSKEFEKNIPFRLAALQALHHEKKIAQNVFFPYSEKLKGIGEWFVQLIAESTGKNNKQKKSVGITPICAVGARDQHSALQLFAEGPKDKFFIFLKILNFKNDLTIPQIKGFPEELKGHELFGFLENQSFGNLLNNEFEGTRQSLTEKECPGITIEIEEINESSLGALFFLLESSTAFLGEFLEINAFDQPGVERSKILTKEYLKKQA